ncbi:3-oxoacyl-ACP synthase [Streptomyces sp. 110]|uniref:3-oxoacyl-ACP synthase n=1 Tax=Streptomyces endocoffeicus TaxID=2898945 RepID=A0ABS1PWQ8_9ACTN|nr:beta-ketoacyl synthase N-terminal-like domain-containing protein [Streptomyces endocoffeicus]MBL1116866.1 3-oxoacyl-ACP synthase [Streptomyces endocoffeicus]
MNWAITGTGAVASIGRDADEVFDALCAGRSGRAPLRGFDSRAYRAAHAYEIDDRPADGTDVPSRATAWLLRAVAEALRDAGLDEDLSATPVIVGTGLRELRSVELKWCEDADFDLGGLHFGTALRERFGATWTYTISNACSASLHALAMGSDLLTAGTAEAVVVAGVDTITASMFGLLDRVQLDPPDRVRPFDRNRRGTLMGDGAAAVVLTRADHPAARLARGRLRAASMNCDASHPTAPDPAGIAQAIRLAHEQAGIKADDVDLILLHGTGTSLNDEAEATALCDVFGGGIGRPLMTAVKSMTGHTSGGSGLLGLIVAARALAAGRVPPTIDLDTPAGAAGQFRFATGSTPPEETERLRIAQVDAFGFGGVNAVAIVEGVAA